VAAELALAFQRGIGWVPSREGATANTFPAASTFECPQPGFTFHVSHPELFKRARAACHIPEARFFASLGIISDEGRASSSEAIRNASGQKKTSMTCIGAADASGKSGSFFFLSPDQQFLAKSCTKADVARIDAIVSEYVQHLERAPFSMLPRYVGLYQLHFQDTHDKVWMVVMTNVFAGLFEITTRFDLKGSRAGRTASKKEHAKKGAVLKDNDFVDAGWTIPVPKPPDPKDPENFHTILAADARFLERLNLIDYSLLLGIHTKEGDEIGRPSGKVHMMEETNSLLVIETDKHLFYAGIVDVLTYYGVRKTAETFFSGTLRCGRDCSCQPPKKYASRFITFLTDHSVVDQSARLRLFHHGR